MDVKMRGRNPAVAEVYIPIPFVQPPITALGESDIKIDPSRLPIFSLHSPASSADERNKRRSDPEDAGGSLTNRVMINQ
jgi:hypothetical protein